MRLIATAIIAMLVLTGCQSAYYAAWEKVGVEKRDILVDRVENAKESQEDAQEAFSAVVAFEGGELEDVYNKLNSEYENSLSAANDVTDRIDKVESVAEALFDEWEDELEKYQNASLKRESTEKLRDTERRYSALIKTMRKAESRMAPVLSAFQDNVLYLKHNLNASAIGALQGELSTIQNDVDQLIEQMNSAIAESDAFIAAMSN
jgi:hypothetical protein